MDCPLCSSRNTARIPVRTQEKGGKAVPAKKCRNCGLVFLEDYAKDRSDLYGEEYSIWGKSEEGAEQLIAESKRTAFRHQLKLLRKYIRPKGKMLLDVGTGKGYLLDIAKEMGFECYGVEVSGYAANKAAKRFPGRIFNGPLEKARFSQQFDVITMTDLIEHIQQPRQFFDAVDSNLKSGGLILVMTPNTGSVTSKLLGRNWFQYKYEHVIYWNRKSLKYLLKNKGYELLTFRNNTKRFNLEHYHKYFQKYSIMGLEKIFNLGYRFLPAAIRKAQFSNPVTGEFIAIAQKK
jgi:2-polyprenyl-3-methyl-5-hydroxy-6-metoxy-1,4-benzoquinol methylase